LAGWRSQEFNGNRLRANEKLCTPQSDGGAGRIAREHARPPRLRATGPGLGPRATYAPKQLATTQLEPEVVPNRGHAL